MRFKLEKIMDEYYSDKTYAIVKISIIDGSLSENFREGEVINISHSKSSKV